MLQNWFQQTSTTDGQNIQFIPGEDRFWGARVLAESPLPSMRGAETIVLSGQGAIWMYAHAAAMAAGAGVPDVVVQSASPVGICDDVSGSSIAVDVDPSDDSYGLVSIQLQGSPALSPSAIDRLLEPVLRGLTNFGIKHLCLTGRGPVDVYSRLAFHAIHGGVQSLTCFSPRSGCIQVASLSNGLPPVGAIVPLLPWMQSRLNNPIDGKVIGVAGDPNTGKSMFSSVLDHHRQSLAIAGWRLDCDAQAPTPPWYLRSTSGSETNAETADAATVQRKSLKRDWTSAMELELSNQLRSMQQSLPITIADLPGGNHKATPPQRLPPGREVVFAPVQSIVIMQSALRPTAIDWRVELELHSLGDRILAILTSCDPKGEPNMIGSEIDGSWIGEVHGLDRTRPIEALHKSFMPAIDDLWQFLNKP